MKEKIALSHPVSIANLFLRACLLIFLFFFFVYSQCVASAQSLNIIPQPVSVEQATGHFEWSRHTRIFFDGDEKIESAVSLFLGGIGDAGAAMSSRPLGRATNSLLIRLNETRNESIGDEGYTLVIKPKGIALSANSATGVFYGLQTLSQLFPPLSSKDGNEERSFKLPCASITDYPRFEWRGLMLDVSRYFFTKEEVKKYIDEMAKYKYNVLQLHLTDDPGWRIEIKSFPELTKTGAYRVSRTGQWWSFERPYPNEKADYGGFYTQDDIREIVSYAQERSITIVPEIEMPAHSLALIASYPHLSCTQESYDVNAGWKFGEDSNVLCAGNDTVFSVIDQILTEVAELFPSQYIHIGGDEANKRFWKNCQKCQHRKQELGLKDEEELQSYFIKRVEKMLLAKNRKLVGWDEILEGGLAPEATVMSWRGIKGGVAAAKQGHKVIMTPAEYCYLDLYQGDPVVEPLTYSMARLTDSYHYEPVPDGVDPKLILGGQGCLWTESVANIRHAEYMTWPRAFALSEVWWSPEGTKNWDDFVKRMEIHFSRLDAADVKYAPSVYDPIIRAEKSNNSDSLQVILDTEIKELDIYYSFDESNPDNFYPKYKDTPLVFPKGSVTFKLITYRDDKPIGRQISISKADLVGRLKK